MRTQTLAFAIATALTAAATPAFAANGDLDATFGTNGLHSISFDLGGDKTDIPNDLFVTSGGGIVAIGGALTSIGTYDGVIAKLTANGLTDFTFGTQGKVRYSAGVYADENQIFTAGVPTAQGDAMVLVGSQTRSTQNGKRTLGLVARFNAPGTYGGGGDGFYSSTSGTDYGAAAVDANGRVACSGSAFPVAGSDYDFYASVYNVPTNSFDPAFALQGDSFVPFTLASPVSRDVSTAVAFLSNGDILQGGYTDTGAGDYDFALARLSPTGDLVDQIQEDFNLAGSPSNDRLFAMKVDSHGRILLAGNVTQTADPNVTTIGLVRLQANLALDPTFGTNGKLTLSFDLFAPNANDKLGGIAIADDGKILVVGTHFTGDPANPTDVALVRLKEDGSADFTFGTFGRETYDFGNAPTHQDTGVAVVVQGDRAIVLSQREYNGNDTDFMVFAVQSVQAAPKPDDLFKNGYE